MPDTLPVTGHQYCYARYEHVEDAIDKIMNGYISITGASATLYAETSR